MNTTTRLLTITAVAVMLLASVDTPKDSGADFTARTENPTSTVRASTDWTPPAVALRDPGAAISGTTTIVADANDGETGISSVTIQYVAGGGSTWTTLCSDTTAPYTCAWNTTTMTNGSYDVRAIGVDNAGYSTTSDAVRTKITQNLTVLMASPGDVVRGTTPVNATVLNPGLLPVSVTIEYAAANGGWKAVCTDAIAPYTCSWDTTAITSDFYSLRAVATSGLNTYTSDTVADVLVDNILPVVSMTDPGSPLSGTATFAATASDVSSGVAQVALQYAPAGSSGFTTLCTVSSPPYSCQFDTSRFGPDGLYDLRATATDLIGNASTSAVVRNRQVDNTVSSVSMEDPGSYLNATVTLTAQANSTAGITSVRIQRAPNGGATWSDVCTDTTAPYACAWDTTTVADGPYDFRALLLDGDGKSTTSSVVGARQVDNSPLRGVDVQATNGGLTTGRMESGDSITLTYSTVVNPATLLPGWTGTSQPLYVRIRDGAQVGLGVNDDTLDVWANSQLTSPVNLGSVNLRQNHVKTSKIVKFNATMSASTVTVTGVNRTAVTVRLGTAVSSSGIRTAAAAAAMVWTPSSAAGSMTGAASSVAPATESGTVDKDF
ncbi:MAG: Ig-like domain-containing protein [Nocardioidaceae bacterium]